MGNQVSIDSFDPAHIRIYKNILSIRNPHTRVQMIQTCFMSTEYIMSAKRAGIYSFLLQYMTSIQSNTSTNIPPVLPGENEIYSQPRVPSATVPPPLIQSNKQTRQTQLVSTIEQRPQSAWAHISETPKNKIISYFSSCLEVLGIQEEVALTPDSLKVAYKKAALRAHPDKGGSEEHFEAITRAYAYLSEILTRIGGGRKLSSAEGAVHTLSGIQNERATDANQWKHADPVRLNPKNLNMNTFNQLFTEMKAEMPDPDSDGYGDWLKSDTPNSSHSSSKMFGGKFNRDVFNRTFEDEMKQNGQNGQNGQTTITQYNHPSAMAIVPTFGTEIGGGRPETYTAPMDGKTQYTDLRSAYTTETTISDKVAGIHVESRNYDTYSAGRKKAPDPLTDTEQQHLYQSEQQLQSRENQRQRRKAEEDIAHNTFFERMKQRVIMDK